MRIRYLLIAGAAALALGLAGCGSSDDDSTADAPATTEPTGPTHRPDTGRAGCNEAEADAAEPRRRWPVRTRKRRPADAGGGYLAGPGRPAIRTWQPCDGDS